MNYPLVAHYYWAHISYYAAKQVPLLRSTELLRTEDKMAVRAFAIVLSRLRVIV